MTGHPIASSRPLRALVALLWVWAGGRAAYELGPLVFSGDATAGPPIAAVPPKSQPVAQSGIRPERVPELEAEVRVAPVAMARRSFENRSPTPTMADFAISPKIAAVAATVPRSSADQRSTSTQPEPGLPHGDAEPRRLSPSLSAWILGRDGGSALAPAGTLGGAQAGFRFDFPVARSLAVTARLSTPLRTSGAEAAMGIALRRGPIGLLLERRFAIERGGRNDFSATLVAGVDDVRLSKGFRLDGYGQVGVVGRDGFADGAMRIERRILSHGKAELSLGAGIWGGAQPGLARLDIGPQIVVRTPIAGGSLRGSGEWRQRVAGNAQPTSGPAITIGVDF